MNLVPSTPHEIAEIRRMLTDTIGIKISEVKAAGFDNYFSVSLTDKGSETHINFLVPDESLSVRISPQHRFDFMLERNPSGIDLIEI